jgi:hypothetical protein
MKITNDQARASGLSRSFWSVGVFGLVLSLGSILVSDTWRTPLSVAAGSVIALLNFWMTAYLVRGFVAPVAMRVPWPLIATVKLVFVLGVVYVLLQRQVLSLLPMVVGFGALPLGIVFGQTRPRSADEELSDA